MGPAIPIIGGVAVLGLVGLRLRALAKAKTSGAVAITPLSDGSLPNGQSLPPGTPTAGGGIISADGKHILGGTDGGFPTPTNNIPFTAAQIAANEAARNAAGLPSDLPPVPAPGSPGPTQTQLIAFFKDPFTPLGFTVDFAKASKEDIAAAFAAMNAAPIPPASDGVAAAGQQAIVTTNDAPPSGDLIIRSAANATAPQIGGAEKNGTVTVLDSSDATFARIAWGGGSRLPPATGFARKAFLKLI